MRESDLFHCEYDYSLNWMTQSPVINKVIINITIFREQIAVTNQHLLRETFQRML